MLGLGDIEFLYQARIPGLAVTLYVIFVILTYVLLINSLIAMMSQTCAVVLEDRYSQWRLDLIS
jgi:transient receptor potential cation channel subfamily V protein 2